MIPNSHGSGGMIRSVHERFDLVVRDTPVATLPQNELELRLALMAEEFGELVEAMTGLRLPTWRHALREALADFADDAPQAGGLPAIAQESSDLLAVVLGNALHYGFDQHAALTEVVRSNFTKLDAAGQPLHHPNGKIKKSALYEPPDPWRLISPPVAA